MMKCAGEKTGTPSVRRRLSGVLSGLPAGLLAGLPVTLSLLALLGAGWGCSLKPTPYQPRDENGEGYEEQRLQEQVWRVSFRANRATFESDVLDYLLLRSAELTLQSGFTHFVVEADYSSTSLTSGDSGMGVGMGLGRSTGRTGWGMGMGVSSGNRGVSVSYHMGIFVIRLLTAEQTGQTEKVFDAAYLVRSMEERLKAAKAKKDS